MLFCRKVVLLNRSYSTNTKPIWKRRYYILLYVFLKIFLQILFLIDINDNIITYCPYSPYYHQDFSQWQCRSCDTDGNHVTNILDCLGSSYGDVIWRMRSKCNDIINTKYKIQNTKYKIQNTKYKIQNTK